MHSPVGVVKVRPGTIHLVLQGFVGSLILINRLAPEVNVPLEVSVERKRRVRGRQITQVRMHVQHAELLCHASSNSRSTYCAICKESRYLAFHSNASVSCKSLASASRKSEFIIIWLQSLGSMCYIKGGY